MDPHARLNLLANVWGEKLTLTKPPVPANVASSSNLEITMETAQVEDTACDMPPEHVPTDGVVGDGRGWKSGGGDSGDGDEGSDADGDQRATYDSDAKIARRNKVDTLAESLTSCTVKLGQSQHSDYSFTPWDLITSYPNRYIGRTNRPRAQPYFNDIFANRHWDFFSFPKKPTKNDSDPFLLVPTAQFINFLNTINAQLDTSLAIPIGAPSRSFYLRFGRPGSPRPVYIGKATSADDLNALRPPRRLTKAQQPKDGDGLLIKVERDLVPYLEACKVTAKPAWTKANRKSKAKSSATSVEKHVNKEKGLAALQRALGLRSPDESGATGYSDVKTRYDLQKPPPFSETNWSVIVAFDVECMEDAHRVITEVGISILDTEKISDVAPGDRAKGWWALAEKHHLRVAEYSYHRNYKFVYGCPDQFNFGESEMVERQRMAERVREIIGQATSCESPHPGGIRVRRPVIIAGHDIGQDIRYFSDMGLNLREFCNVVSEADSQDLYCHVFRQHNGRSLQNVLLALGLDAKFLHNAGNDAAYTLQAILACAALDLHVTEEERLSHNLYGGSTSD